MSDELQQVHKALKIIEEQIAFIQQALGSSSGGAEGIIGVFDGEFMVDQDGKKHQIPPNYASKSMLVAGDTIKMVEDHTGGPTKFKQIDKVERVKLEGVLAKKDGKFEVLTDVGSFKVLPVAVKHYNGESGDQARIQIPRQHNKGGWAAFEKVLTSNQPDMSDIPQVLMDPIIANQQRPENTAQPSKVASDNNTEEPQQKEQPERRSEERSQSGASKSKSRKKKKKSSDTSGPKPSQSPARNSSNNNSESKTAPASSPASTPEFVEVAFDEDDLV